MARSSANQRPPKQSQFVHESPPPDLRCDYAAKPFDEAMRAAERKWGIDRLHRLVSPETASKWGSAMDKLNAAIDARDADEIAARAAVCVRGLQALDAEAHDLGADPLPPGALTMHVEGRKFVVLPDHRCWPQYEAAFPGHIMLTLKQIGVAMIDRLENSPAVQEARKHFPDAKVSQLRPQTALERDLDDEIPF